MDAVDSCDATRLEELLKAIGSTTKPHLDFTTRSDGLLTEFGVRCSPQWKFVFLFVTPLSLAVIKGYTGIVKQLICAGASVDYTGSIHFTPLMLSVAYGHKDTCLLLLRHGADIDLQATYGLQQKTALYLAACNGESEIVSLLLEHKAKFYDTEISWTNHYQVADHSPIAAAIASQHPCTTAILLDHFTKQDLQLPLESLFNLGLYRGSEECLIVILQQGFYPPDNESNSGLSCFHRASQCGMIKLMCLLLELNPGYMQERWLVMKSYPSSFTQHSNFILWLTEYRKYPSSLVKMCKSTILYQLGLYYMAKIKLLPLPTTLKIYLSSLASAYGHE